MFLSPDDFKLERSNFDLSVTAFKRHRAERGWPSSPALTVPHHGITLSLYYQDPDGNRIELQADALPFADAIAFMAGPLFAANPVGVRVDSDALLAARRAGADETILLRLPDGPPSPIPAAHGPAPPPAADPVRTNQQNRSTASGIMEGEDDETDREDHDGRRAADRSADRTRAIGDGAGLSARRR